MEAIGALLFFIDIFIFNLAIKAKGSTRWYWVGFIIVNVLGFFVIIFRGKS